MGSLESTDAEVSECLDGLIQRKELRESNYLGISELPESSRSSCQSSLKSVMDRNLLALEMPSRDLFNYADVRYPIMSSLPLMCMCVFGGL